MALSDKFINAAEEGAQSAKSVFDKIMRIFHAGLDESNSIKNNQATANVKAEQNLTADQTAPSNLNAQNTQNLTPSTSAIKEANLTVQRAQISHTQTPLNLNKNSLPALNLSNLPHETVARTDKGAISKSEPFDIELNENLGVILIGDSIRGCSPYLDGTKIRTEKR